MIYFIVLGWGSCRKCPAPAEALPNLLLSKSPPPSRKRFLFGEDWEKQMWIRGLPRQGFSLIQGGMQHIVPVGLSAIYREQRFFDFVYSHKELATGIQAEL